MEIAGNRWRDPEGRRLILRGVNLGGDSKVPAKPDGWTGLGEGFYSRDVSFVGRPFPLDQAREHLGRLKRWGFTFLRLVTTWEAVEHAGPGLYDEAYLDYLEALIAEAGAMGFSVYVDPHQDVWSRWTGGDGAPLWTLEAVGFRPELLHASGAALLHQEMGSSYPRMRWISNALRLGCATMFTLFFAGDEFAPGIRVEGESVQGFLQSRYLGAMRAIATRVARLPAVVGFGSMNEPSAGWIGVDDLARPSNLPLALGAVPTPWDAIRAGSGFPVEVPEKDVKALGLREVGRAVLGRPGLSCWDEGKGCVWRRAGLWDLEGGVPRLRDGSAFARRRGGAGIDFCADFLRPFALRFAREVRGAAEGARRFALFIEGVPNASRPTWRPDDPGPAVDASHWYDDITLVRKRWTGLAAADSRSGRVFVGKRRVRRYFKEALAELRAWTEAKMSGIPTLLGEFGLPFDLNGRVAYERGDYSAHVEALSAYYDAVDANLMDSTLWNYSAANVSARGDLWNDEDLSIYSAELAAAGRSETGSPEDAGGRALRGFVRPYARAVAGEPISMSFDRRRGAFSFAFSPDPAVTAPTEIFVPALQYPAGYRLRVEGGAVERSGDASILLVRAGGSGAAFVLPARVEIRIERI